MGNTYHPTDYDDFAEIYDAEYQGYHASLGDVEFYKSFIRNGSEKVLELCCGTGRISLQIAKVCSHITGVDVSEKMLQQAYRKLEKENETVKGKVDFLLADMKDFYSPLHYDFAFIGFRSFMLLLDVQDQIAALLNIWQHLIKDGFLVISLAVPTHQKLARYFNESANEYTYFREFTHPNDRYRIVEYEKKSYDQFLQVAIHHLRHVTVDENGLEIEITDRQLNVRYTYLHEFMHLARYCGYAIDSIYGGYRFEPFDKDSTEMICVLKRLQE